MKVSKNQIFNLMDTNGRRNDVINALQGYLVILERVLKAHNNRWAAFRKVLLSSIFINRLWKCFPMYLKSTTSLTNS